MNKRILLSVLIIGAVMTGTFLVTRAFFSNTQTATGSTFTTGTLDMTVNGVNGTAVDPFVVSNIGTEGNIGQSKVYTVNNAGTLDGRLYFRTQDYVNTENGCNEPEDIIDGTCDTPGIGQGELGSKLHFKVELADGSDPEATFTTVIDTDLDNSSEGDVQAAWNNLAPVVIPASGSKMVKVSYYATENEYGNEVQSDSTSFNTRFDLVQLTQANPTP